MIRRCSMSMENMSDSMLLDKYNMMCQRYERNLSRGNQDTSARRQLFQMFNEINRRGLHAPQMDFFFEFYGSRRASAFDENVKYHLDEYGRNRKSYRRLSVTASKKDSE